MNRLARTEGGHGQQGARWGSWDNDLDRVLQSFLTPGRWIEEAAGDLAFPLDVVERENEFVITSEIPGAKKEDISVTLENGVLTVSAEVKDESVEKQGDRVVRQERRYGKYVRSLRLGTQVDEKSIKAQYKDGVLQLTLPKAESVKPKKINVDVA
ncbi:MAG TPA: Hsp20/alpha crystallin family protein [Burkholderiales bacterium]|nr:Hsp20/alpha crystallin family protein [Burkholderiales bacterium]